MIRGRHFYAIEGIDYWTVHGPDGSIGWGAPRGKFSAEDVVRSLDKAYELGRAEHEVRG